MKYKTKHQIVDAIIFSNKRDQSLPGWALEGIKSGRFHARKVSNSPDVLDVKTQFGTITAVEGDYIILHENGNIFVRTPDGFNEMYEPLEDKE